MDMSRMTSRATQPMNAKSAARGAWCWDRLSRPAGRFPAGFTFFLFNEVLFIPPPGARSWVLPGPGVAAPGTSLPLYQCKYLAEWQWRRLKRLFVHNLVITDTPQHHDVPPVSVFTGEAATCEAPSSSSRPGSRPPGEQELIRDSNITQVAQTQTCTSAPITLVKDL
ncbi:hypothetical protein E2C01_100148 [Portunus trituberculatus]|uniref:Uncharacterized protein n=1 Tax=Portunus trituberculatus TaxID=210409 RepID=A0A5B7KCS8_PORTR|nr:hypothetical protein [Portunus trituberculatus]